MAMPCRPARPGEFTRGGAVWRSTLLPAGRLQARNLTQLLAQQVPFSIGQARVAAESGCVRRRERCSRWRSGRDAGRRHHGQRLSDSAGGGIRQAGHERLHDKSAAAPAFAVLEQLAAQFLDPLRPLGAAGFSTAQFRPRFVAAGGVRYRARERRASQHNHQRAGQHQPVDQVGMFCSQQDCRQRGHCENQHTLCWQKSEHPTHYQALIILGSALRTGRAGAVSAVTASKPRRQRPANPRFICNTRQWNPISSAA